MVKQHPLVHAVMQKAVTGILILIVIFNSITVSVAGNSDTRKNRKEAQLLSTFYLERSKDNKTVLKLYDDKTYEYLHFIVKRNQPVAKRETGTYKWKNKKLILHPRSGKKSKYHSGKFYYDGQAELTDKKNKNENEAVVFTSSTDERFKAPFYSDSVFGIVSNDKRVANKLRDYKYLPKPKPSEIKTSEAELIKPQDEIKDEFVSQNSFEDNEAYHYTSNSKVNLNKAVLQKLKAVIVVGADEFDGNKEFIREQKKVAAFLKSLGVEVKEYYYPNSKWETIQKGAVDANLFIYSGHGITYGDNDLQGTIYINEGIIEGPALTNGLKLHKNALVIFNHACYSAGASADDKKDIGIKEATTRVEDYAEPFINLRAGCYYASNYSNSIEPFLTDFFNGVPVSKIYRKQAGLWDKVELIKKHKTNPVYETGISSRMPIENSYTTIMSIDSKGKITEEKIKAHKSYDVAYVGIPSYTVWDMIK